MDDVNKLKNRQSFIRNLCIIGNIDYYKTILSVRIL